MAGYCNVSSTHRVLDEINQICDGEHDNEWTRVVCQVIMDFLPARENANPIWQLLGGDSCTKCSLLGLLANRLRSALTRTLFSAQTTEGSFVWGTDVDRTSISHSRTKRTHVWRHWSMILIETNRNWSTPADSERYLRLQWTAVGVQSVNGRWKSETLRDMQGNLALYHWTEISHN